MEFMSRAGSASTFKFNAQARPDRQAGVTDRRAAKSRREGASVPDGREVPRWESYVSILQRAKRDDVFCEADETMPLEVQKSSIHSYGAQFCEVRVGEVTGETRACVRFLGSFDTGRILNAKLSAS
jgi:CO/xanthine dehydrogenase Mo-binding subunit